MGYLLHRRKTTRVIPRKQSFCKAKNIADVLNSNSWNGERCFIICGGPSLENFNFSLIQNEKTIGINKSFLKYPTTLNYAMDQRFYDQTTYSNRALQESAKVHSAWLQFKGLKVFLKSSGKTRFDTTVCYVKSLTKRSISLDVGKGIYGGNNSGFGGMMLAVSLGCRKIYMLGLDMKIDENRKRTHWHEGYPGQRIENVRKVLERFKAEFEFFAHDLKKLDISVINLNPDSALTCFPKKDIREVL